MTHKVFPYKIIALAPFAPVPDEKFKSDFIHVDLNTLDRAVEKMSPVLFLPVSTNWCSNGALTLKFDKIKDFKPKVIIGNNAYLRTIKEGKTQSHAMGKTIEGTKSPGNTESKIDDILSMVETADAGDGKEEKGLENNPDLSILMQKIYSDREFRKTESAWRGLQTLVKKAGIKGHGEIDIRIASVSHNSLEYILQEIESLPFEKLPNLLLIDMVFNNTNPHNDLLDKLTDFADRMLLPVVVAVKPAFFRIKTWSELNKIPYIRNYLDHVSYVKWNKIKKNPGAVWLVEVCNSFPVRDPNEFETQPVFASPVWALGTLCAKSVRETGWPTAFTKYTSINIDNLPMFSADGRSFCSVETLLSEDRIMQFTEAGITPLAGGKNKDFVFIPKQTSLAGRSIKIQMFFNRIIEALIYMRNHSYQDQSLSEEGIESLISDMLMNIINMPVDDLSVSFEAYNSDNQAVFIISFTPPAYLVSGAEKIEFSFAW